MKKKINSDPVVQFFIVIIGLLAIGILFKELQHIILPFVIAYILFFLFQPLNMTLRKIKIPGFVLIILNLAIVGFISFSITQFLIDSLVQFSKDFNDYAIKLNKIIRETSIAIGIRDPYFKNFSIQKIISKLDYKELAGGVFSSAVDLLGSIFLILFFYIFIFSGHNGIFDAIKRRYVHGKQAQLEKKIKKNTSPDSEVTIEATSAGETRISESQLANTFKAITEQIQKYIIVKIANNLAAGILVGLALYIWGVDFPILWGAFTFFLNFIPTIGSAAALFNMKKSESHF
jgi:predicted PurR-regulated permease PerM